MLPRTWLWLIGSAASAALTVACVSAAHSTAERQPAGWSSVTLRLEEQTTHGELELRWLEVRDSRCPVGVQCVWAGEVIVELLVERAGRAAEELTLVRATGRATPVERAGYEWVLDEVTPVPRAGVAPAASELRARVELRPLREGGSRSSR